jgi:hypothetical protein
VKIVYKSYNLCATNGVISEPLDAFTNTPRTLLGRWNGSAYVTAPVWFTWISGTSYTFNMASVTTGTTVIGFSADGIEYLIIINKGSVCAPTTISYTPECCTGLNIVWLNREGGYQSFLFGGKRAIYEINDGEAETFKTQNLTLKNSSLKDVYRAVVVNTGVIDRELLSVLESLRNSIQAWVYDEDLPDYLNFEDRFTPIIVDRESMIVRDTKERIVERTFRFLIAKELNIQGQ